MKCKCFCVIHFFLLIVKISTRVFALLAAVHKLLLLSQWTGLLERDLSLYNSAINEQWGRLYYYKEYFGFRHSAQSMKSEQSFGRDARFPSKEPTNGWAISLVVWWIFRKKKKKKNNSAFKIGSKHIVFFHFSLEGGGRQDCLCLIMWTGTLKMFGQPARDEPTVYVMFQYLYLWFLWW